jgi:hypothetical protein
MLPKISLNYENSTVVLLRMHSGEMIIGRYAERPDAPMATAKLLRARTLIIQPLPNGQANIQMIPIGAPFFTDDDCASIDFPSSNLVTLHKKAPKELENAYIQMTSGIRVAGVANLMPGNPNGH